MDKKIIFWGIISIFYILLALSLYANFGYPNGTNDFVFHYFKANHEYNDILVNDGYSLDTFYNYPSLYHELVFFTPDPFLFWLVGFAIIFVGIPFMLYKISGTKYVIPVYFCLVNFPHFAIFASVYPSALVIFLALIYFYKRKFWVWGLLFIPACLLHRSGLELFIIILVAELLSRFLKEKCFMAVVLSGTGFNLRELYNLLTVYLPVFVILPALKKMSEKREYFYLIIFFVSLLAMQSDIRTYNVAQMVAVIFSAQYFKTFKYKKLFWFTCGFFLFINLLFYVPSIVLSVIFI